MDINLNVNSMIGYMVIVNTTPDQPVEEITKQVSSALLSALSHLEDFRAKNSDTIVPQSLEPEGGGPDSL